MAENHHEAFTPDLLLDRDSLNELLKDQVPIEVEPAEVEPAEVEPAEGKLPEWLHITGDAAALASAREILLTTSPLDAHAVHEATGRPVALASTFEELPDTARRLAQAYPEAQLFVVGPDAQAEPRLIREHIDSIRETALVTHVNVLSPIFTQEEREQGCRFFQHYERCRDHPQQVIRDTIEGGIEAAYEVQVEQMAEPPAVEKDGTSLIIVDHQPSAALIRLAFLDAADPPALMSAAPDALETTIHAAKSLFPEKDLYLLAPVAKEAEPNPYQEIAEQHGVGILSPSFSPEELSQGYRHFNDYKISRDQVPQLVRHEIEHGIELAKMRQAEVAAEPQPRPPLNEPDRMTPFEVAGDPSALAGSREILVGAHAADAHAVSEATGRTVVIAPSYDALPETAQRLAQTHPEAQLYILGHIGSGIDLFEPDAVDPTIAAIEAAAQLTHARVLMPELDPGDEISAQIRHFADYAAYREDPGEAIRFDIETPIEIYQQPRQPEREPPRQGPARIPEAHWPHAIFVTDHQPSAALIQEATHLPVVLTEQSSLLPETARVVASQYPMSEVVIVGDHARGDARGFASERLEASGILMVYPELTAEELAHGHTHFGDYAACRSHPLMDISVEIEQALAPTIAARAEHLLAHAQEQQRIEAGATPTPVGEVVPALAQTEVKLLGAQAISTQAPLLICADEPSAQAVYHATGKPVFIVSSPWDADVVADALRETYPEKQRFIVADEDGDNRRAYKDLLIRETGRIYPDFTPQELDQGCEYFKDYAACRNLPGASIRRRVDEAVALEQPELTLDAQTWALREKVEELTGSDDVSLIHPRPQSERQDLIITADREDADLILYAGVVPVVVSHEVSRLPEVAEAVRDVFPEHTVFILGHAGQALSQTYEREAAERSGAALIYPEFSEQELAQGYHQLKHYRDVGRGHPYDIDNQMEAWMTVAREQLAQRDGLPPIDMIGEREAGDPLLIATVIDAAAAIHEATGRAVVVAGDAHLYPVAKAMREKEPETPILICGDNHHHLAPDNVGRLLAEETAQAVGGKAVVPVFTR